MAAAAANTHAMASSTQGFDHFKKMAGGSASTQVQNDSAGRTKKTAAGETTMDEAGATTGVMAKTEAGEGMFGADLDMDSLTDSDDEHNDDELSDLDIELKKKKKDEGVEGKAEKNQQFKIVAGEDSDSIFEERL